MQSSNRIKYPGHARLKSSPYSRHSDSLIPIVAVVGSEKRT